MSSKMDSVALQLLLSPHQYLPDEHWFSLRTLGSNDHVYTFKKLKHGHEYEMFEGSPEGNVQIAEVTEGKILHRGVKYFTDKINEPSHGVDKVFHLHTVMNSPWDSRKYKWDHKGLFSAAYTFVLEDVETKDVIIQSRDRQDKPHEISFSPLVASNPVETEFWILAMMQYRIAIEKQLKRNKKQKHEMWTHSHDD